MAPSFGTSGLRGLVTELTPDLVTGYIHAFLSTLSGCDTLFVGRDLRASSPEIAACVIDAARAAGVHAVPCGALPTPALALAAMHAKAAAVMVTGSHIPADRNGLKFYTPAGEISKADEAAISAAYTANTRLTAALPATLTDAAEAATAAYAARYIEAFGLTALKGLRIGIYRHSSVARDLLQEVFCALGAEVIPLGHSETFLPIDTEAISDEMRAQLRDWCSTHALDAIVSTDGDADRPMLTAASGAVIAGDILGVLTARFLGAQQIVTPISSNDMVRRLPEFTQVTLTRIGSPFVIAAMQEILAADPTAKPIGFEASGGFLLGFPASAPAQGSAQDIAAPLEPLLTRDSLLPLIVPLLAARKAGKDLAALIADLPPCFTAADRIQGINADKAAAFLNRLIDSNPARRAFFEPFGTIKSHDLTDGLRLDFESGDVIHLRPSGNAPEFRIYAQSGTQESARVLVAAAMKAVSAEVL